MSRSAHVFTGQGFEVSQVTDYTRSRHFSAVADRFAAEFGRSLPKFADISENDVKTNEVSAAILCISGLDNIDVATDRYPAPIFAAGFSVGQYLALHYARSLTRDQLIALLFERCQIMNVAAAVSPASLLVVLGLPSQKITAIIEENGLTGKATLSNDNAVGNYTYAVLCETIDLFAQLCEAAGAYRVQRLQTTGGWHSPFVASARPAFESVLEKYEFAQPAYTLVDNTYVSEDGLKPTSVRQTLLEHLVKPVRWRETIKHLAASGVSEVYELTDFDLLSRMGAFTAPKVQFSSLGRR